MVVPGQWAFRFRLSNNGLSHETTHILAFVGRLCGGDACVALFGAGAFRT